jgi:hypothetical protein
MRTAGAAESFYKTNTSPKDWYTHAIAPADVIHETRFK